MKKRKQYERSLDMLKAHQMDIEQKFKLLPQKKEISNVPSKKIDHTITGFFPRFEEDEDKQHALESEIPKKVFHGLELDRKISTPFDIEVEDRNSNKPVAFGEDLDEQYEALFGETVEQDDDFKKEMLADLLENTKLMRLELEGKELSDSDIEEMARKAEMEDALEVRKADEILRKLKL